MRLLRRHILRTLAAPFFFSLAALTGMLMVNQLARRFGDLVGKDLPGSVIFEVLALSIPFIIALTLPMAVLVAILYGFSQLGSDSEITAMRANGISVFQMLRPVLGAGLLITAVNFLFVDQILPRTNARLKSLQGNIGRKKPAFQMREQAINDLNVYFIRASRIFAGSGRLRDVTIYDLSPADARRVIYADSGQMSFDQNQVDLILYLYSGVVHEFKPSVPGQVQLTRFITNTIRVRDVQNLLDRNTAIYDKGDREMSTCEMMDEVSRSRQAAVQAERRRGELVEQDLRALMGLAAPVRRSRTTDTAVVRHCGLWRTFEDKIELWLLPEEAHAQSPTPAPAPAPPNAQAPGQQPARPPIQQTPIVPVVPPPAPVPQQPVPQQPAVTVTTTPNPVIYTTPAEVLAARDDARATRARVNQYLVEIHKKYAISVACFTFVLIGVAMALRFPRGGMGLVIGGGLVVFAIFYIALTGGESLADRGYVTPAVAMWISNVTVGIAGIVGLIRVNREFGSTRGGDLGDFFESMFGWLRRRRRET
ncbi:MAG: LptF/LptG family permease [Gemmatimonadota bacterium]